MIYKVYFQEIPDEIPVRERTKSIYVEATSEAEVRKKIIDRHYNIEFIHPLDDNHLAYEQQNSDFQLENV
ncbi:DNA-dependent RNA polymerase subunit epsilon [Lentibacillus saliphilus]|uniref:DNA-dependent RNA polymerase subunit epsilon n=1 Tax=Lentibacillus saliphilus TaxID=2737028 RepID=UPI001C303EF6|nr:DNA-directed RNA polymerase subunit epsilon [Lentibacillus saliphilus]